MSVLINNNGSLVRQDAAAIAQLAAVDTENILGGGAGATTDGQTLVDQLAADDAQAQTDIGQIKTDLPNYLTIADEQVLGAWNVLAVPATLVTATNNGVTFTVTRDSGGQVTEVDANGTAGTGGSRFTFTSDNIIRKGRYYAKNGTGYSINYQENGVVNHSGNTDDFVVEWSQDIACRVVWDIAANTQVNHVKFYPQLALKPNMPYAPYAMTNAELTAEITKTTWKEATLNTTNFTKIADYGGVYYCVKSGVCYVQGYYIMPNATGGVISVATGLPKTTGKRVFAMACSNYGDNPLNTTVFMRDNATEILANVGTANKETNFSFSYPVA